MSFMRQFWNAVRGKKEFIENANGTVKDINDYETVGISVETEELPLPDLEEYPHLTAYVKDRDSGFIDATIVLTKEGEFGVAFTSLSEPKIDKKYGRKLALYRAINNIDLKPPQPTRQLLREGKGIYKDVRRSVRRDVDSFRTCSKIFSVGRCC